MKSAIWNKEEEIKLLNSISSGILIEEIAKNTNRSSSAIDLRLKKIIFDNITAGKTINSLAKMIKLPEDKVQQYYYEYKGFLEKKGKLNNTIDHIKTNINNINPNITTINKPILPKISPDIATVNKPILTKISPDMAKAIINKPILTKIDDVKANNMVLIGGKSSSKVENHNRIDKKQKILTKIKKMELENGYMKNVLDNVEMRKKINKLIENGILDKNFKKIFKKT
jgi:hypothetical protein